MYLKKTARSTYFLYVSLTDLSEILTLSAEKPVVLPAFIKTKSAKAKVGFEFLLDDSVDRTRIERKSEAVLMIINNNDFHSLLNILISSKESDVIFTSEFWCQPVLGSEKVELYISPEVYFTENQIIIASNIHDD